MSSQFGVRDFYIIVFLLKTSQEIKVLSHCLKLVGFCFRVN